MQISAFRGYRYARVGRDVSAVVAPPYDQISPETQRRLYDMHPNNVVRVTYPLDGPDKYQRARQTLERWLAEGVWQREGEPALYPYHQTYGVGGRSVTRMGFIALGDVTPYSEAIVLPHERTHAGPKRDRLALLEATGADMGLLFMLVGDPGGELLRATSPTGEPIAEARDLRGETHRLWRITDPETIVQVTALMASRQVIIADGHHRYETAVDYANRNPDAQRKMMAFCTLEAPGLTIFPNHRLIRDVPDFSLERFVAGARPWFDVSPLPDPLAFQPTNRTIGLVTSSGAATLTLLPNAFAKVAWPAATSDDWRGLAVSMLHEGLLKPLLSITDEKLDARTNVDYTADQTEAVTRARRGDFQAAFLIAPTTAEELQAIVKGGEVLPQKSTHFYPKLLDGLVFARLRDT